MDTTNGQRLMPFHWREYDDPLTGEEGYECLWCGYELCASRAGSWAVWGSRATDDAPIVSWRDQARGTDTEDAMRRAQAAAMALHRLR